jgi:CheY-like chemotaxis protein
MTNEAILAILDHFCNEARNFAHATFGIMELRRSSDSDAPQDSVAIGRTSADQLLRSIDDVRDLLTSAVPEPGAVEEFDLGLCAGEIVEVLNLASGRRSTHMTLDTLPGPLAITQDRKAVEQILTRVLDTAFKLAQTSEVRVGLSVTCREHGVRMAVAARDTDLAVRLAKWLNANLDESALEDPGDVPFGVAVMVAGKRLRHLGGSAALGRDPAGHSFVSVDLPSQAQAGGALDPDGSRLESRPDFLTVLVAEDCDDSFVLSELVLHDEHVRRARDGAEALRMIQKHRFDVVLMDVHMPGMDGYAAIRCMRDWETQTGNARIPIVVLSSDDLETQRKSAAQCGCSGFLRKPLRRSDLTSLLDRLKQARMPVVA